MTDVRIGLVGAGGIARTHAAALAAMGNPVVVTSTGDSAVRLAQQHGFEAASDLGAVLGAVDVVVVATPTPTHPSIVRAAIAAGRDVICEKPMARTAAQAQELVDAAEAAGVLLLPGHVVRWFPTYAAVHAAAAGLRLDRIELSREVGRPAQPWFHDVAASGGVVMDLAIHDLDQAAWLAGPVASVVADTLDDGRALATLTHRSGVVSTVEAVWSDGDALRTAIRVRGPGIAIGGDSGGTDGSDEPGADVDAPDPYRLMLQDLLAARATGTPSRVSAADGVHAVAIAEAVLASADRGGDAVRVEQPRRRAGATP